MIRDRHPERPVAQRADDIKSAEPDEDRQRDDKALDGMCAHVQQNKQYDQEHIHDRPQEQRGVPHRKGVTKIRAHGRGKLAEKRRRQPKGDVIDQRRVGNVVDHGPLIANEVAENGVARAPVAALIIQIAKPRQNAPKRDDAKQHKQLPGAKIELIFLLIFCLALFADRPYVCKCKQRRNRQSDPPPKEPHHENKGWQRQQQKGSFFELGIGKRHRFSPFNNKQDGILIHYLLYHR